MLGKRIKIILVACLVLFVSLSLSTFINTAAHAEDDSTTPFVDSALENAGGTDEEKLGNIEEKCRNAGINGISWAVCPILVNLTELPGELFNLIDGFLQIKPTEVFITTSDNKNVSYEVWSSFRNIANIIIVVILLIVIFSQITGVGIDNYGIKKILPKIIIMAILLNLSYIICQLAVDLSNIIGSGLEQMFTKWSSDIFKENIPNTIKTIEIVFVIFYAISLNPMSMGPLVIIIVLLLIVAIICIGIIWISLGMRNMLVIVFTIVSPVAFALYILPNTQVIFKNWWKVFKACLLIFPICGALYGASLLIQAVTFTSDDISVGAALFALVAPVVPFLFIPKLLKAAIAGLGALGATIQSVTSAPKRAASAGVRAAKRTETYKNARQGISDKISRNYNRRAANLDDKKLNGFQKFIRGGDAGIARARIQYVKDKEAKDLEKSMMGQGFATLMAGSQAKADAQKVANQEALMAYGKVPGVNVNDPASVGKYHAKAIKDYQAAGTEMEKVDALNQIKAAQNILSKTDAGRSIVQNNLEQAVSDGDTGSLRDAASHLLDQFGDKYKSVNRGAHSMIKDLATMSSSADLNSIINNIGNGTYNTTGTDKYTAESLSNADDQAIRRLVDSIKRGIMGKAEMANIQATAYEALEKQRTGTLNIKPEVARQLEQIIENYTPPVASNQRANIISHGAYEASDGSIYHLRQMDNGKFLNDDGVEVDITHFKKH